MRTMVLALGCIAAVICGAMLAAISPACGQGGCGSPGVKPSEGIVVGALVLALAATSIAWLLALGRPNGAESRIWWLVAAVLVAIGLARGASASAWVSPSVAERGWGGLREFEVVGASTPGVRCEIELRDPRARRGAVVRATLKVTAPPESCPLADGQRVAVLPQALGEHWRDHLGSTRREREHDLGQAPVLWLRPSPAPRGRYWHFVAALRQRAWDSTRGDPSASLVVAIGIGLRSALAPEQREQLRAAGLGHLIAVSGLHVAIAALWLSLLIRRGVVLLGGSPRWACLIAWIPLWGYVGLTGAAASAVRAALMLTGIDLAALVGRPHHGPTLLASAAAAMLLWQPQWLFDPGFALSLAAMAAIVTAPRELGLLAMSWRITWATAPLSVLWFDQAPLHGLIGNAIALPIFSLLMPLSLVATLVPGSIGLLAMDLAKIGAAPILDLATLLAELPSAGPMPLLVIALVGLLGHRWLRGHDLARVWLPPKLACGLAVLISAALLLDARIDRREAEPIEFEWIAVGSVQSRSLLVVDHSAPASACLFRPTDSAATWLALLDHLGVRRLARIEVRLPDPARFEPPDSSEVDHEHGLDPGARALTDQLARAGIELGSGGDRCDPPSPERVRAALRACRFRQAGRGRALARSHAGVIHCRIGDRWVVAAELGSPDRCIHPACPSPSPG